MLDEAKLRQTHSIEDYLKFLAEAGNRYSIILAIRDTPGDRMPEPVLSLLHRLGFSCLLKDLWRMYVGVIKDGHALIDCLSNKAEETVYGKVRLENAMVEAESHAWRKGNKAVIKINGIECAPNRRGLNMVVYDDTENKVIDSIWYDSHDARAVFEHNVFVERINEKLSWLSKAGSYDVCVAGVWYGANYGSLLNGYATYRMLKEKGKSVLMLNKPFSEHGDRELRPENHNIKFITQYFPKTAISPLFTYEELPVLNKYCECFCAGSDQIWNYNICFDEMMYLPFVSDSKQLISFVTSFGSKDDHIPESARERVKSCFRKYDAISVREEFDKEILSKKFGVESTVLIDPIFCLQMSDYEEIARESDIEEDGAYIVAYILDPTDEKLEYLLNVGRILNKKIITVPDGYFGVMKSSWAAYPRRDEFPNLHKGASVPDFLKLYINADFVVTDSFHGTAFSIMFRKRFVSICNHKRGKDRFYDLLGRFALTDRLIELDHLDWKDEFAKEIEYESIRKRIEEERAKTLGWLGNALMAGTRRYTENTAEKELAIMNDNADFIKIRMLATLLRDYGVEHVVLSPGGRDVPIVRMFEYNDNYFKLHRVTDERSAAYFGLGIASKLQKPVACVCTSGTAASNFLPAVTEAYFTGVPLIVITADRYEVYHGQGEDQTIPQRNIYRDVVKRSFTVPEGKNGWDVHHMRREISHCIIESTHDIFGPVHINIAINDIGVGANAPRQYWAMLPWINPHIRLIGYNNGKARLMDWVQSMLQSDRIMVVYGQNAPLDSEELHFINEFANKFNCVILTDHISNLSCDYAMKAHNMLLHISQKTFNDELTPDILITVGGKRLMNDPLTFKVRGGSHNIRHWSVSPDGSFKDFYFRLTSVLEMSQKEFFRFFAENAGEHKNDGGYYEKWRSLNAQYTSPIIREFNSNYVQSKFFPQIPANSFLHLGVGQSFYDCRKYNIRDDVEVYCNMGTNGIDGCTSTFMGQCAVENERLCFLIVGDLSFFYDMNSVWNKELKKNIRILLVNNSGSGLLRGNRLRGITAAHNAKAQPWVESMGFEYISASTMEEYVEKLIYFLSYNPSRAVFFEVFCD